MEIIKSGKNIKSEYIEKYKLTCQCGCEFICNWNEYEQAEKSMQNARMWFKCPECGETVVTTRMNPETLYQYKRR